MISCQNLAKVFKSENFNFFTGIPCSILKNFVNFLSDCRDFQHIIPVSEGEALALAAGYHLATGKIGVVYMQNSGLGEAIDPLTSLMNKEVYNIPVLLLISWRGETVQRDEPQHLKMGQITLKLLKILNIPYVILPSKESEIKKEFKKAKNYFKKYNLPYAFIIKKGSIEPYQSKKEKDIYPLTREEAIKLILNNLKGNEAIISTTGKTTRELFELREEKNHSHKTDFYNIGSMGYSAGIALGIVLQKPKKRIFIFDGDGSILMKMGTMATIGHYLPKNFYHIIFDNSTHDSTGGQKTVSNTVDFIKIALGCGYKTAGVVSNQKELTNFIQGIKRKRGPIFLVVKIKKGAREDLRRPTRNNIKRKELFMGFLNS